MKFVLVMGFSLNAIPWPMCVSSFRVYGRKLLARLGLVGAS